MRLHQPAAYCGVDSRELGQGTKDAEDLNAGLYGLSSGAALFVDFGKLMQQRFGRHSSSACRGAQPLPLLGSPAMFLHRRAAIIATAFTVAWTLILLAGTDHPPPIGFLWLLPAVLACGLLLYRRVPDYARWRGTRRPGRAARVLAEGFLSGLMAALVMALRPGDHPMGLPASAELLVWFAALGAVGLLNAALAYSLAGCAALRDP